MHSLLPSSSAVVLKTFDPGGGGGGRLNNLRGTKTAFLYNEHPRPFYMGVLPTPSIPWISHCEGCVELHSLKSSFCDIASFVLGSSVALSHKEKASNVEL